MKKHISIVVIISIGIFLYACESSSNANMDWEYKFVVFQKYNYLVTEQDIAENQLNEKIGEIKVYSDKEIDVTSETVFSNEFKAGTPIYSINGKNNETLAVKTKEHVYEIKRDKKYGSK